MPSFHSCVQGVRRRWAELAVVVLGGLLILSSLAQHAYWCDEAITAFYARSVVRHGRGLPQAWDGRNLLAFGGGTSLDENMAPSAYPLLQFYVAAPFFALFDQAQQTLAGRLPFALLGLATLPLVWGLVMRWTGNRLAAVLSMLLLATSVQFLLMSRQCRYFSLTSFFSVLLILLYPRLNLRNRKSLAAFIFCGLLLFHSHFLLFFTFMGGLALAFVIADRDRERFKALAVAAAVLLLLTVPYAVCVLGGEEAGGGKSLAERARLLGWYLRDMNRAGFFPALTLLLLPFIFVRVENGRRRMHKPAVFFFVLILGQVLLTAVLSPEPVDPGRYADANLRYVVNLLPFAAIVLGLTCARVRRRHVLPAAVLLLLLIFSNFLTCVGVKSFKSRCYIYDYVHELLHGYDTNVDRVLGFVRSSIPPNAVLLIEPPHQRDPLIFYLGDRYRFCGVLPADDTRILPKQKDQLPAYIYSGDVVPDWIVMYGSRLGSMRADIRETLKTSGHPVERYTTDIYFQDTSRPELIWHRFKAPSRKGIAPQDKVVFLRVVKDGNAAPHNARPSSATRERETSIR